jgi:protein arginine kinase
MSAEDFLMQPWKDGESNDVVLYLTSEIRRNISGYTFPDRLFGEDREALLSTVLKASKKIASFIPLDSMKPLEKKRLKEAGIISSIRPSDRRYICFDHDLWRWCTLLSDDHLSISARMAGISVKDSTDAAYAWESEIEKNLDFAFSLDIGYLLSEVSSSGTGLFHQALAYVPALGWSDRREDIFHSLMTEGYSVGGFSTSDGAEEDLFVISSDHSFGISEEESVNKFAQMLHLLVHYERRARENIEGDFLCSVQDKVYRAYGILASALKISSQEARDSLLSLLLGSFYDMVEVPRYGLCEMLWKCGDAHIRSISEGEGDQVRADLLRKSLGIGRITGGKDV